MQVPDATVLRRRLASRARLRHLEVLVAVAEMGSVHGAAQRVGLGQPGVTKYLRDLEQLLETPLFLRHARGMKTTLAGEQLVPIARRMLKGLDEVAERAEALARKMLGTVRVVSSQGGISRLLAEAVPRFHLLASRMEVTVQEADPLSLNAHLSQGEADLAVCRQPELMPQGWVFTPLVADRMAVIAGAGHALARRKRPVQRTTLAMHTWLGASIQSRARTGFDALFDGMPASPARRNVGTRSPVMLWSLLRGGDVLALLPLSYMHEFLAHGLLIEIPAQLDQPLAPIGMLLPEHPTPSARHFADYLVRSCGGGRVTLACHAN